MVIKSRRKAREAALQALYSMEVGGMAYEDAWKTTLSEHKLDGQLADFAKTLIDGVYKEFDAIDIRLEKSMTGWTLDRLAVVDRNVLRIGVYELVFLPAIPPNVTLNEAIEISKKFSTADSGKFVNGVLAGVLKNTPKANWDPATAPAEFEPENEEPEPVEEQSAEPEEELINEDEADKLQSGGWTLRTPS